MVNKWIAIHATNNDIEDTIADFTEVLADMGITVENDEDEAANRNVDLFIRIERSK